MPLSLEEHLDEPNIWSYLFATCCPGHTLQMKTINKWQTAQRWCLPSTKPEDKEFNVVSHASFGIEPAIRLECVRVREGHWVARNCPEIAIRLIDSERRLIPVITEYCCPGWDAIIFLLALWGPWYQQGRMVPTQITSFVVWCGNPSFR
jgi:hypothetical protein